MLMFSHDWFSRCGWIYSLHSSVHVAGLPTPAMKTRELLLKTNLCHAMESIKHMIVFVSIIIATETRIPL